MSQLVRLQSPAPRSAPLMPRWVSAPLHEEDAVLPHLLPGWHPPSSNPRRVSFEKAMSRFRQGLAPTEKKTLRHPLQDLGRSPTPPSATLCQARLLRSIQSDNYVSGWGCVLVVRDGLVACTSH